MPRSTRRARERSRISPAKAAVFSIQWRASRASVDRAIRASVGSSRSSSSAAGSTTKSRPGSVSIRPSTAKSIRTAPASAYSSDSGGRRANFPPLSSSRSSMISSANLSMRSRSRPEGTNSHHDPGLAHVMRRLSNLPECTVTTALPRLRAASDGRAPHPSGTGLRQGTGDAGRHRTPAPAGSDLTAAGHRPRRRWSALSDRREPPQ